MAQSGRVRIVRSRQYDNSLLRRHLAFPLLTHLYESGSFAQDQVEAAQYELAKGTNMVEYIASRSEMLNPDSEVPKGEKSLHPYPFMRHPDTIIKSEFAAKRETALAINEQLQREAKAIKCWLVAQCEISQTPLFTSTRRLVLDIIENADIAQALQTGQEPKSCLSEGQLRCELNQPVRSAALTCFLTSAAHPRENNRAV